ncbi:MAG TPA: nitroreductase family protein, partial [SAR202 cluster bacterium]|nr:nitroreductase family protein [SAR202 cluster bacterium]
MEVYEAIQTRLTVRRFKPDAVPDDVAMKLLRAGQWAPSSRNLQPWHFIVVRDRDMLKQIGAVATSGSFVADA